MSSLPENGFICTSCRLHVMKYTVVTISPGSEESLPGSSRDVGSQNTFNQESITSTSSENNSSDGTFPESPKPERKRKTELHNVSKDCCEILETLKKKFTNPATSHWDRIRILTIAPKSWSIRKTTQEFGASRRMAQKARNIREEKGVLASPNPKVGSSVIDDTTRYLVIGFYEDDDNSRLLPGTKDYVSVRTANGTKEHVQKRLVLCNLKELFCKFKKTYPDCNIDFSKFAQLHPKHCVLSGSSGTHCVCVYTYHENIKLMVEASQIPVLTRDTEKPLRHYQDFFGEITCSNLKVECRIAECDQCSNTEDLKTRLVDLY